MWILGNLGKKWKDCRARLYAEFYKSERDWETNLAKRPEGIPMEQWASFLIYRESEDVKVMRHVL